MWKIINRGAGIDLYAGGVKCYLAPGSVIKTNDTKLVEEARKVPYVLVTEDFSGFSLEELRTLASQRGIKKPNRLIKKKLLEKLQAR